MKYIQKYESMNNLLVNPQIKIITDKLREIFEIKKEFVPSTRQIYDNNITSTFFIKGRNPQSGEEIKVIKCIIEIGVKGIDFEIKKSLSFRNLERKNKQLDFLRYLLNIYGNENKTKVTGRNSDFYILPISNYNEFINELTIENFETYKDSSKYNV